MKRKILYAIGLVTIAASTWYVISSYEKKKHNREWITYPVLERKSAFGQTAEWSSIYQKASNLAKHISTDPADHKSLLALTSIYLQEARISGNFHYYNKAAMQCVNKILERDSENFEGLTFKSMILLSDHHFAEGMTTAEKARNVNSYNAFVYGLLVDANVEMGNYEAAVAYADKMVSIRPDMRSYSRIAYLREIHGDIEGAIEAMKMALDAGPPGDEGTEWSRTQLGKLYEQIGKMDSAQLQYKTASYYRPGYPYSLTGMGRIAVDKGEYQKALHYYHIADSSISDFSIQNEIGELYLRVGKKDSAQIVFQNVLNAMTKSYHNSSDEKAIDHHADLELAFAWIRVDNLAEALEHAQTEYKRRPGNIDVNEALAWIYYRRGEFVNALNHIKLALRTNCKNPVLLCRAALIFAKNDDPAMSRRYLHQALNRNPNIPASIQEEISEISRENPLVLLDVIA